MGEELLEEWAARVVNGHNEPSVSPPVVQIDNNRSLMDIDTNHHRVDVYSYFDDTNKLCIS